MGKHSAKVEVAKHRGKELLCQEWNKFDAGLVVSC